MEQFQIPLFLEHVANQMRRGQAFVNQVGDKFVISGEQIDSFVIETADTHQLQNSIPSDRVIEEVKAKLMQQRGYHSNWLLGLVEEASYFLHDFLEYADADEVNFSRFEEYLEDDEKEVELILAIVNRFEDAQLFDNEYAQTITNEIIYEMMPDRVFEVDDEEDE